MGRIYKGATEIASLLLPSMKGYVQVASNAVTSVTVDPSTPTAGTALSTGDWMLLAYVAAASVPPTTPSGWVVVADVGHFGTRYAIVYGRVRQAGDTSYTIATPGPPNGSLFVLMWGGQESDTTIADWLAGTPNLATGSGTTITAPGLTTTQPSLVLTLAFEASTATEADVSSVSGATEWFFSPQQDSSLKLATIMAAYVNQSAAGTTGTVTVTYPNATANHAAVQVSLPGASGAGGLHLGGASVARVYKGSTLMWGS